jgi:hypothetical protein
MANYEWEKIVVVMVVVVVMVGEWIGLGCVLGFLGSQQLQQQIFIRCSRPEVRDRLRPMKNRI